MSTQPLISIIVPVYNCERYIASCIESILEQTMDDLELILVDDGSTDSSYSICEKYFNKYSAVDNAHSLSIKLLHKNNGGVSSARNLGIEEANGRYLMFIDSDDTIDRDCCRELFELIESTHAYLAMSGYSFVTYRDGSIDKTTPILPEALSIGNIQDFKGSYIDLFNKRIYLSACAKLFRRSVLSEYHIRFNEQHALGEDLLFVHSYLHAIFELAQKTSMQSDNNSSAALIAACPKALYNYNQYPTDSLSKRFGTERIDNNAMLYNHACELIHSIGIDDIGLSTMSTYYMRSLNIVFMHNRLSDPDTIKAFRYTCSLPETKAALKLLNSRHPEQLLYILAFGQGSVLWLRILCMIRTVYIKLRN